MTPTDVDDSTAAAVCAICAANGRTSSRMFCVRPSLHLTVTQDLEHVDNDTLTGEHRQNGSHSPGVRSIYRLYNRMYTNLKKNCIIWYYNIIKISLNGIKITDMLNVIYTVLTFYGSCKAWVKRWSLSTLPGAGKILINSTRWVTILSKL